MIAHNIACARILIILMSSGGYKIRNQLAVHFLSFAVVEWIDVFTRPIYQDIVLDSLKYCQQKRGLVLNAWCLMPSHMHLVGSASKGDLSGILRDFKSFTSTLLSFFGALRSFGYGATIKNAAISNSFTSSSYFISSNIDDTPMWIIGS